jgi:dUTP pyrophosphatase
MQNLQNDNQHSVPDIIISQMPTNINNSWEDILCVEKLEHDALLPYKSSPYDAGYDLFSYGMHEIKSNSSALIGTKIRMRIPTGYYGRIASRSGLAAKNNIEVGAGVVDSNYRGEIFVLLRNFSNTGYIIQPNDKIAQIIITPYSNPEIRYVEHVDQLFGSSDRGDRGFGSSGR